MSYSRESQNELYAQNERLARAFYSNGRYSPYFLFITAVGFFAIYLLTLAGFFGQSAPQLIPIGILTSIVAVVQFPLLSLARRNRGVAANLLGATAIGIFAVLLTCLWKGITPISLLIAMITPISALRNGIRSRYIPVLLLIVVITFVSIIYVERTSTFDRLQNSTPAAVASLAFMIAIALLLITITAISENKKFSSLQALLLTSFIFIVSIPTLLATILSTVGAFANSQTQTFSSLEAISNLKVSQISTLLDGFRNDANKLQNDPAFSVNALSVLKDKNTDPSLLEDSKRVVRSRFQSILGRENEHYTEAMVLNPEGVVLISTNPKEDGANFRDQLFFLKGSLGFYAGFTDLPAFGTENFIVASPVYDIDGRTIRGALVLKSNANTIKGVMETTPGFENAETYLVNKNYRPVTRTRAATELVLTQASSEAIKNNVDNAQGIYTNYDGQRVLGIYKWFDSLQVAMIAEMPLSYVIANSLRSLGGSVVLALFVIASAIAAVTFSARSIAQPIRSLAQTTENFAAGKLSARAPVDRADEIGALARSYNQMANQLQEIIGGLEQRVTERTKDLESQTFRLRAAAEVARDAASARDLSELLERSAQLIQSRFGFYHAGIFLLDNDKEYAILVASPTDAGKQMLANNHRLRVGEVGIVGRVAATGEPRVTLDTDADVIHFNNPYLPNTRSEMALPLKAEHSVIGVLDIQSDQAQAFNADDVAIMQIMADQLAIAIERMRLLQEVQSNLKELESAYGQYTHENWKRLSENTQSGNKGYRFDNIRMESITELSELGRSAFESGKTMSSNGQGADHQTSVAIPVRLRGQTIGVINLTLKENYAEDTISTVELASERLAAALESARLYEEARLRADREQSIAQVTSAISASSNYEEILQTTVREIGSTLKDAEVTIQITGDIQENRQNG
jgi:GAF domain-containing protein/HAMP domain-containing protein